MTPSDVTDKFEKVMVSNSSSVKQCLNSNSSDISSG